MFLREEEQIRGERIDTHSDIFSLGIILYEMTTGRHPFRGENYVETMHNILKSPSPPLSKSVDPALVVLNKAILRCLEKERERRFQRASDVFEVRGAQLMLVTPISESTSEAATEAAELPTTSVTYRDPSNWLVWSGPILVGVILIGIFATVWLSIPPRFVSGCITSSDGRSAVLDVSEPPRYRGEYRTLRGYDLLEGYDFRPEIGHQVTASYTDVLGTSARTGNLYVRDLKRLAGKCDEFKSKD